ncbi:MAG: hypothetical protein I3274_07040 [Candidatus Moeniiplasma glomeromycotorum]|nr:hypothetical protein [Candidatus Moeniiplasma glomeromycotorum]
MGDPDIIVYRKHTADGAFITATEAVVARNGKWEANEIQVLNDWVPQIRWQGNWHNFDWTNAVNTKKVWAISQFLTDFRAVGSDADDNTKISDIEVNNNWKKENGEYYLTGTQAGQIFNNGWHDPAEIRIINTGVVECSLDGGVSWLTTVDPRTTTRKNAARTVWRNGMGGPAKMPRNQALQGDGTNVGDNAIMNAWFGLTKTGGGDIEDNNLTATNARDLWDLNWEATDIKNNGGNIRVINPLTGANEDGGFTAIQNLGDKKILIAKKDFTTQFQAVSGNSASASETDILPYFGKGLTPLQAAALYNANPPIPANLLTKGDGTIDFVGVDGTSKNYDLKTSDGINNYNAAKKAKNDADEAARKVAELASAKTTALNNIQTLMDDTSDNKSKLTEEEVKTQLNTTDNNLIDGTTIKDWKDYINAAKTTSEVSERENKVKAAIAAIREAKKPIPFDPEKARTAAITAVKNYWKSKSSDKTENGTINSKSMTEILGENWEDGFNDKDNQTDINGEKKRLTDKIDTEKAQEPTEEPPREEEKLTDEKVENIFKNVLNNTDTQPTSETVKSWQEFDNEKSELKTEAEIKTFLEENIKDKEELAKTIAELPTEQQPTGNTPEEKVNNFVIKQKAEIVIQTIFKHKLKDENYQQEIAAKMEKEKDGEKILDEKIYPKKDGKFTPEAMARYLYEKKTGKPLQFATKSQEVPQNPNTTASPQSHWDQWKYWYIGGAILMVVIGLGILIWKKSMEPSDSEIGED